MAEFEFCTLGASKLDDSTSLPTIQAVNPLTDDTEDVEHFGDVDVFGSLGVTSLPYPADDNGFAEGLLARDVPGSNGVIVGARDERTADITGAMKPGDTVLHSTGPEKAAQFQCKEEKRQVVMATTTSDGKSAHFTLDGKRNNATLAINGALIQVTSTGNIILAAKDGTAIEIGGGQIKLLGNCVLGGAAGGLPICVAAAPGPGFSIATGSVAS